VQVPYNAWVHVCILFIMPVALLQLVLLIATGVSPLWRRRRARRGHAAELARAKLQQAAAAAIACNISSHTGGGRGSPVGRMGRRGTSIPGATRLRHQLRGGLLKATGIGIVLRSPLRERIHLEALVFMSLDHCSEQPELVAEVILQVHRRRSYPACVPTPPAFLPRLRSSPAPCGHPPHVYAMSSAACSVMSTRIYTPRWLHMWSFCGRMCSYDRGHSTLQVGFCSHVAAKPM
jgi:hypothetical protein